MTPRTGSYRWASPENLRGDPYFLSTDVYSYSMLMYEIITGLLPNENISPAQEAGRRVVHEGLRPTLAPQANCPAPLVNLLKQCWHEDPFARPTFPAIVSQLKAILADLPPPSPSVFPLAYFPAQWQQPVVNFMGQVKGFVFSLPDRVKWPLI